MSILMAVAAVIMVIIVILTCGRAGIINIPGITPEPEAPKNIIQVGYLDAAAAAGTPVSEAIAWHDVDLDYEGTVLPDDVITPEDPLDGYVLSLDLYAGTPVCQSMICAVDTEELYNATTRDVEFTYIDMQKGAVVGDYVDVHLSVSSTKNNMELKDEIVLAKKEIIALNGKTVTLRLNADELTLLTAAQVEATIENASKDDNKPSATIYTTKYVNFAQPAAQVTYTNDVAVALIEANPNLLNNPDALYEAITGEPAPADDEPVVETPDASAEE